MTAAILSRPIPVSIFLLGNGFNDPSGCLSNWVNTRFQTSVKRLQSHAGEHPGLPQPALTRSLKAGKLTGIELGRLSAGRYRVSLAPAARGVTGRTVSKLVKIS
jgi:hypothetical protein